MSAANRLSGTPFHWNEEKMLVGTTIPIPFLLLLSHGKVRMWDNPGQETYSQIRQAIAQKAAQYRGFMIFIDDTSQVFAHLGYRHALAISRFVHIREQGEPIPTAIVSNKKDFTAALTSGNLLKDLASYVADAFERTTSQDFVSLPYFDRMAHIERVRTAPVKRQRGINYMTISDFEQKLVSLFDEFFQKGTDLDPMLVESIFTKMNLRILARSLIMGFYELVLNVDLSSIPGLAAISPDLYPILNERRPTFLETNVQWSDISPDSKEPPFILDLFSKNDIVSVMRRRVLGSDEKHQVRVDEIKKERADDWEIVADSRISIKSEEGIQKFIYSLEEISTRMIRRDKKDPSGIDDSWLKGW